MSVTLRSCGEIAYIAIENSARRNCINMRMADELFSHLDTVAASPSLKAVVFEGDSRAFCAGADLKELSTLSCADAHRTQYMAKFNSVIPFFPKPTIAAVSGLALGLGFELALLCDMAFCTADARFALPELTVGSIPGVGGTQRLTAAVGKAVAFDVIVGGKSLLADEALRRGVVCETFESRERMMAGIGRVCKRICGVSAETTRLAKRALVAAQEQVLRGVEAEQKLYYETFDTAAFQEGMAAFLEKRSPDFEGL